MANLVDTVRMLFIDETTSHSSVIIFSFIELILYLSSHWESLQHDLSRGSYNLRKPGLAGIKHGSVKEEGDPNLWTSLTVQIG